MSAPRWIIVTLWLAAAYNLIWGTIVVMFPRELFALAGVPEPNFPSLVQCIGMIVGVYGIGYGIAATDPQRHWPMVLVGLTGKILGPIGFVWAAFHGELPWILGLNILTNDIAWWLPFVMILSWASRQPLRLASMESVA